MIGYGGRKNDIEMLKAKWVVVDSIKNELRCKRCGDIQTIPLPIPIDIFVAMSKAFVKLHKHCKEER